MSRPVVFPGLSKMVRLGGSVEDTQKTPVVRDEKERGAYLYATALPDASLIWLQDFSMIVFTLAGIGT